FVSWVHPALRTFLRLPALAGVLNTIPKNKNMYFVEFQIFIISAENNPPEPQRRTLFILFLSALFLSRHAD
ncbi:hypothetical protein ACQCRI_16870, partial [Ralstonia pseudosolanacearum]|uniref:hypothetical protein n=1 Tax=Ralstonia pseudosolanacearum TaxID=1310165 RepID=UPI003CF39E49